MPKSLKKYNAADLLEALERKGFANKAILTDFIFQHQKKVEKTQPRYLKILAGLGALIAVFCFIGFLEAANVVNFQEGKSLLLWGLVFISSALGLQKAANHTYAVVHSFLVQSSFTCMVLGKVIFVLGVDKMFHSHWAVPLALLAVTAGTYHVYAFSLERFLSSFAVLLSFLGNTFLSWYDNGLGVFLLNGFFLCQFVGTAILLAHGKVRYVYLPLRYAFAASLGVSVLLLVLQEEFGSTQFQELINPTFMNVVLTGGLLALFGWVAGGVEKLKTMPWVLAVLGAVFLGYVSIPGVLLAIGFMVFGYSTQERVFTTGGIVFLLLFLWLYYYSLDVSLLQKSALLVGSGITLLAGRLYLKHTGLDSGGGQCGLK